MAKGRGSRDICDGEHYYWDSPHFCDKAKVKKAKEDRAARSGNGVRNSGCSGGCGGRRQGDRNKCINNKKDGDINKPGTIRMYAIPGYLREPVFREKRKWSFRVEIPAAKTRKRTSCTHQAP